MSHDVPGYQDILRKAKACLYTFRTVRCPIGCHRKVIAYQIGGTRHRESAAISVAYVDGVSITHGNLKEHIRTLASALAENVVTSNENSGCSCFRHSGTTPPSFVGTDYFCDGGLDYI